MKSPQKPNNGSQQRRENPVRGVSNIYGQTNFNQAKVNQIEFLVKTNKIDILHLQETNILEETFENSNYLKNNYQILFQNNESGFGVCSLINNELETKNVLLHPSGIVGHVHLF